MMDLLPHSYERTYFQKSWKNVIPQCILLCDSYTHAFIYLKNITALRSLPFSPDTRSSKGKPLHIAIYAICQITTVQYI